MRHRRGFTLVEIMVALVIMLIVTGAIYKLLHTTQRVSRAQAEHATLQANVRAGSLVVPNELRELNTVVGGSVGQNDILAMNASSITYRAMRGFGLVCQAPTATQIRIARSSFSGYRDPAVPRDSVYVFVDGDETLGAVDSWIPVQITAINPGSTCGANAAIALTVANTPALTAVPVGTPVRTYEVMQLQLYVADGRSWLGARSVSGNEAAIQPVLGPLTDGNGFQLEYFTAAGAATADVRQVNSVRVTFRGVSDRSVNTGSGGGSGPLGRIYETLQTRVSLRNSFRP